MYTKIIAFCNLHDYQTKIDISNKITLEINEYFVFIFNLIHASNVMLVLKIEIITWI